MTNCTTVTMGVTHSSSLDTTKTFSPQATTCTLELLYSWNRYQPKIIDKPG